jgi:hypothetical protein
VAAQQLAVLARRLLDRGDDDALGQLAGGRVEHPVSRIGTAHLLGAPHRLVRGQVQLGDVGELPAGAALEGGQIEPRHRPARPC